MGRLGNRPGGLPDATAVRADEDVELPVAHAKLNVAPPLAGGGTRRYGPAQRFGQLREGIGGGTEVREHTGGELAQERRRHTLAGKLERKEKFRSCHLAGFYSERRSNSTRARPQSIAICARRASSPSNARSSRRRCTNPTRTDAPYRSRSKLKTCVSTVVRPEESTVGRTPMLVTDGLTTPSIVVVVAYTPCG